MNNFNVSNQNLILMFNDLVKSGAYDKMFNGIESSKERKVEEVLEKYSNKSDSDCIDVDSEEII